MSITIGSLANTQISLPPPLKVDCCWYASGGLHIWDAKKEEHPQQANIKFNPPISSIRISVDGSKVFFLDMLGVQAFVKMGASRPVRRTGQRVIRRARIAFTADLMSA